MCVAVLWIAAVRSVRPSVRLVHADQSSKEVRWSSIQIRTVIEEDIEICCLEVFTCCTTRLKAEGDGWKLRGIYLSTSRSTCPVSPKIRTPTIIRDNFAKQAGYQWTVAERFDIHLPIDCQWKVWYGSRNTSPGQNATGQNATGQNAPDKMPLDKMPPDKMPRTKCHGTKCHRTKCPGQNATG